MDVNQIKSKLEEAKLSKNTIENYINGFKGICKGRDVNINVLLDTKFVSEKINSYEKSSTRKTYFETCNSIAKYCDLSDEVKEFYKNECKILRGESKKQIFTEPTQQDIEVSQNFKYEDVAIKRDELRQTLGASLNTEWYKWILCCLYSRIPPLRCGEFYSVKLRNYNINIDNFIDLEEKTLIINDHKTKKSFDFKVIELEDELVDEIKLFYSLTFSDYLLPKITKLDEPMDRFNVRYVLNQCFGKHVSSTTLRNIYVSTVSNNKSAKERIHTAEVMGHNFQTQQKYYTKFDDTLHPEMKQDNNNVEQEIISKIQIDAELINLINVSFVNGILIISKK